MCMPLHGLPDLPHSDYPVKILESTPLVLRIPVQGYVDFLEFCDQIWTETFAGLP